jgi:formylglycine-generating enzyme
MGSENFYPEERPVHQVTVDGFWIDEHPVTVAEFQRFVKATGYVTLAERPLDPTRYPEADPNLLVPGALVFPKASAPVDLRDYRNWWEYVPGAQWRHPGGPGTTLHGRERHPVTQVAHEDAQGLRQLGRQGAPNRSRMGVRDSERGRGQDVRMGRRVRPDEQDDGGRRPSGRSRRTGAVTMTWPATRFNGQPTTSRSIRTRWSRPAALRATPGVTHPDESYGHDQPGADIPRLVTKGGSHLCAPNYCLRYRPAARQGEAVDTSTGHIGFRCVLRGPAGP